MKAALTAISALLLATSAVAQEFQSTSIVAPIKGQTIQSGKAFNVTLNTAVDFPHTDLLAVRLF
jgi:hypothetical protein